MKKGIFSSKGFVTMVAVVIVMIMPSLALSTASLSLIDSAYTEVAKFDPPDPPWAPLSPDNIPTSIAEMIEVIIGTALSMFGVNPVGSIYGPGISSWDNYVAFGEFSFGQTVYAQASAVGTVASWNNPLLIGDTQYVKDTWYWAAIYELNGDPGESVGVHVDYIHDYTYYNLAIAGRSRATTDVLYGAYIIPAAKTGEYTHHIANMWPYNPFNYPSDASFMDGFTLHGGAQYKYIGGFTEATQHKTGTFDLGSMNDGDRLYVYGYLGAYTECEMYLPLSLDVATMFPSFQASVDINEVPEPTTMLLLGSGLIGLAAYARRKFKK